MQPFGDSLPLPAAAASLREHSLAGHAPAFLLFEPALDPRPGRQLNYARVSLFALSLGLTLSILASVGARQLNAGCR